MASREYSVGDLANEACREGAQTAAARPANTERQAEQEVDHPRKTEDRFDGQ